MAQTILLVDDSQTVRSVMTTTLKNNGYEVLTAIDGLDALEKLEAAEAKNGIDLVLTDINMPNMGGIELITKIKADPRYSSIPVITLTSESEQQIKEKGKEAGAIAWIVKPSTPEKVRIVVKMILRQYGKDTINAGVRMG